MTGVRAAGLLLGAAVLLGGCQPRTQPRLVAVQLGFVPGFEADAEWWTLSVGGSGRVRRTWEDWGGFAKPAHPPQESTLDAQQRREFLDLLDPRRMARFGDHYRADGVTDLRSITLTLITDTGSCTIATYGLDFMADENERGGGEAGKRWPEEAGDLLRIVNWLLELGPAG